MFEPNSRRLEMAQQVRAIVSLEKGAPVSLETLIVPDPGPGEARVAVKACGVCHTDLHYREGGISDDYPGGRDSSSVTRRPG